jgi:hypothetical protein
LATDRYARSLHDLDRADFGLDASPATGSLPPCVSASGTRASACFTSGARS